MTYMKKTALFISITIVFVLMATFCISATVVSQSHISEQAQDEYRKAEEKEYVTALRSYLAQQGYHNSGVTLTSVTDTDGSQTYTATIHHAAIDRLTEKERQDLIIRLETLESTIRNHIYHEFLIINQ
ncbi:MAG: hypothetical protein IKV27_01415 [Lachnospiraceae bacterium]|nr:hypothetical protein [Lachnospiraceae bacterium]